MNTYVWCEDKGAGFTFWNNLFGVLHSDFIVETKNNNTELCKAVQRVDDIDNVYYVLIDSAVDNPNVLRELQRIYSIISAKEGSNIKVISVHSFEFVMLSFRYLEEWIFAKKDLLREKRAHLIDAKNIFVNTILSGEEAESLVKVRKVIDYLHVSNSERLASKLLYEITRNTGFETTKGKLGDYFIIDCCYWEDKEKDDICGLDNSEMSAEDKIKSIFEHSVLKEAFKKVGL